VSEDRITARCFGGPLHDQMASWSGAVLACVIPHRVRVSDYLADGCGTIGPAVKTGTYSAKRVAFGRHVWWARVYDGGWVEDEPVEDYVILALTFLWTLARVWRGLPA
jgi:hypothetical protein